ncbi:hypothetical protein E0H75_17500 [Kribbella capetownensis]|uniref:Pyridoxamine 5'-phosphate oxidase n=1 Tax=Kribbella capetownensis TaxID=1572659 RepID=A0A4R0JRV3_9ACTN|nr:hypothetical protein [Kribbella capetownensis]TCC50081.1 hypothetical protein E0H75_17500 [Kribbella capetownensis]
MVVQKEFLDRAHRIVWCTVATVGPGQRPRTRILHPVWELADELTGWIVTRATPVKVRHLAYSPYLSCSYWEPGHEVAVADCRAEWIADVATRQRAWELTGASRHRSATTSGVCSPTARPGNRPRCYG